MEKQKYQIGQENVMLGEVDGKQLPLYEIEIIGFELNNDKPYKIRYQKEGDATFWIDDVEEIRLISMLEIANQVNSI